MKTLHISIIIGIAGMTKEYMEKTCSKPGTNCPLEDPWYLAPFGMPGLVLTLLGIYLITSGRPQKK
ncbi:hypothetical protein DYY66_2135 [Candidatus Nitrosotalea sp. FS]|nr:hypothetical protein [Candidatus Nitrosotalea sp. FS]